jgi:Ca2+-transporting ATPase
VAIGAEQAEPDVLSRAPRSPDEPILTRVISVQILVLAAALTASSLGTAIWARHVGAPWQSCLFATLCLGQLGLALATRSDSIPVWRIPWRANPMLAITVLMSVGLVLAALYLPPLEHLLRTTSLTATELLVCLSAAVVPAAVAQAGVLVRDSAAQ